MVTITDFKFNGQFMAFFFLCMVILGISIAEGQSDVGRNEVFLRIKQQFYNAIENSMSSLEPSQRVSLTRAYERELDNHRSQLSQNDYLDEKLKIANRFWEYRDFEGALQAYEKIALLEPDSKYAARAYMMRGWIKYGNLARYDEAIIELKTAREIADELLKTSVDVTHDFQVRDIAGRTLSTLGEVYFVVERNDDAIEVFEYLLGQPEIMEVSKERRLIHAYSSLARALWSKGDHEEALKYYKSLDKAVQNSTQLSPDTKIHFAMERMIRMGKVASEKELVLFLEELWMEHKDQKVTAMLRVGNTLTLIYFFSKEKEINKKFAPFVREFKEFFTDMQNKERSTNEDLLKAYSIGQQALLLWARHLDLEDRPAKLSEIKQELRSVWQQKEKRGIKGDFEPSVSSNFPSSTFTEIQKFQQEYWPQEQDAVEETERESEQDCSRNFGKSVIERRSSGND